MRTLWYYKNGKGKLNKISFAEFESISYDSKYWKVTHKTQNLTQWKCTKAFSVYKLMTRYRIKSIDGNDIITWIIE